MAIHGSADYPHWTYCLAFDTDLLTLARYVEFTEANFGTFSIEIARILLASASEVDVVCKRLCTQIDANSTAGNIHQCRDQIRAAFPGIVNFEVRIPRFNLELHPWSEWSKPDGVPFWWTAYNKVKHERHDHFAGANLKNALNAVAGLFVVVLYLYRNEALQAILTPAPQVLYYVHSAVSPGGGSYGIQHPLA